MYNNNNNIIIMMIIIYYNDNMKYKVNYCSAIGHKKNTDLFRLQLLIWNKYLKERCSLM